VNDGTTSSDRRRLRRVERGARSARRSTLVPVTVGLSGGDLRGGETAVLEELNLMQDLVAVKRLDVARLRRRKATDRPAEVHKVRLDRMREWMHPDLLGEAIALARVARATRRNDVVPVAGASARERDQVVAGKRLTHLQLRRVPAAILATIAIASEEEGVRHLPAKAPWHVDELGEADDGRAWHRESLGADDLVLIRFDNFGLAINHEAERSPHRDHGERLERRIQSQTANDHAGPP